MATSQMNEVMKSLRRTVLRDGAGILDRELLEAFVRHRDVSALADLVRRHGPMVWGVCRRILHHQQDAEDAFQATFLVFVRKAAAIQHKEMVGNWLYGVAHNTAIKARAVAARRGGRERQVAEMPEPAVAEQELRNDLQPLIDQELCSLPDKYRVLLVLCDLEGKTRKEAAQQLGCPEGTVAGRLARARTMLAKRLARRGVAISGGALAAILSQSAASACVPTPVVSLTITAASKLAAGQAVTAVVSPAVAALTEGVLKVMMVAKLKVAMAVFLVLGILGTGSSVLIGESGAAPGPSVLAQQEDPTKPKEVKPADITKDKPKEEPRDKKPEPAKNDVEDEIRKAEEEVKKAQEEMRQAQAKYQQALQNMIQLKAKRRLPGAAFPGFQPFGGGKSNRLGAKLSKPSDAVVEQLKIPEGQGLTLDDVSANSAAAKAGLQKHDILLELGGKKVSNQVNDFLKLLNEFKTGDKVEAVVLRAGKKETVKDITLPDPPKNVNSFTIPTIPPIPPLPKINPGTPEN